MSLLIMDNVPLYLRTFIHWAPLSRWWYIQASRSSTSNFISGRPPQTITSGEKHLLSPCHLTNLQVKCKFVNVFMYLNLFHGFCTHARTIYACNDRCGCTFANNFMKLQNGLHHALSNHVSFVCELDSILLDVVFNKHVWYCTVIWGIFHVITAIRG